MKNSATITQILKGFKNEPLFTFVLFTAIIFEWSNHYSLILLFMAELHPEPSLWDKVLTQAGAIFGAIFIVSAIVATGLRDKVWVSFALALVTCGVSFAVYGQVSIDWHEVGAKQMAVTILSVLLPLMVFYSTHQIAVAIDRENDDEVEALRRDLEKQERMNQVRRQYSHIIPAPKTEPIGIYRNGVPIDDLLEGKGEGKG